MLDLQKIQSSTLNPTQEKTLLKDLKNVSFGHNKKRLVIRYTTVKVLIQYHT